MCSSPPVTSAGGRAATLACGVLLSYSLPSFVPAVGEDVPCPRHGYCAVAAREVAGGQRFGVPRAAARRSPRELVDFLQSRPETSVHVLRARRFTLRIVVAAQRKGLVDVDLVSGRVALRTMGGEA